MSDYMLKFNIKFYKESDVSIEDYTSCYKTFFENCHTEQVNYSVTCTNVRKSKYDFRYEEEVYIAEYLITCYSVGHSFHIDNLTAEICRKWCEGVYQKRHLYWLMPSRNECFYYEENRYDRHVNLTEFAFGMIPDMRHFVKHYHYRNIGMKAQIMSSFFHSQKYFIVYLALKHNLPCTECQKFYTIFVKYQSIARIITNNTSENSPTEIYFELDHPPFLYAGEKLDTNNKTGGISDASAVEYDQRKGVRTLEMGCDCSKSKCHVKNIGRCQVLKLVVSDKYRVRHIILRLAERCRNETEICYGHIQSTSFPSSYKGLDNFPNANEKTFSDVKKISSADLFKCSYSWKALCTRTWMINDQLRLKYNETTHYIHSLKLKLVNYAVRDATALSNALFHITKIIDKHKMILFEVALDKLFDSFIQNKPIESLPDGMCLVRRIIITPSRMLYMPPAEHFDNRVIRKFGVEYMLRISVEDDNFSKLTYGVPYHSEKDNFMQKVVGDVLLSGIRIGNRLYEILAASNSQLREHGIWLYAKDNEERTAAQIRKWLGDFRHIKNVAKYVARMGICFSTSEDAVQLSVKSRDEISMPDITNNGHIFSDGIGAISSKLAEEVRIALLNNRQFSAADAVYKPSAFQIRYRGCKGMVVEDPRLEGRKLGIRPSMTKFDCTSSNSLEVVKTSAPRKLFLNRPLITILEQLGVPSSVFLKLQKEMMLHLFDSLIYESKAASTLTFYTSLYVPFSKLQDAGIFLVQHPFFRSLLLTVYKLSVTQLRSKVRIAIPPEFGRNMLGVMDETGTLKYGQVFVQYSEKTEFCNSPLKILKGTVVVTKNPCMHPGDVRKLYAVDVPCLHHIKDCIVFPSRGRRPHPDEMAGSDLDGDEYVVLWYPELIFPKRNFSPMIYPPHEENQHNNKIGVADIIEFFCNYIRNDHIGTFANAHLAWADMLPRGIFSARCLSIAEKYPYVLDFAKTGFTQKLERKERPYQYPDFMEKGSMCDNYYSKKTLGFLYRTTKHLEASVSKAKEIQFSTQIDKYLETEGWKSYEESAKTHRKEYVKRITNILDKFGIGNEAEALLGYVDNTVRNLRHFDKNTASIIKVYIKDIMQKFRSQFLSDMDEELLNVENLTNEEKQRIKFRRASAWYMVDIENFNSRVMSFPWILGDILAEMRIERMKNENIAMQPMTESIVLDADNLILDYLKSHFDNPESGKYSCLCITLGKVILQKWLYNSGLSNVEKEVCSDCFSRLMEYFLQGSSFCCKNSSEQASSDLCSPASFILQFLKFFIFNGDNYLGKCNGKCEGFLFLNFQAVALQALADFAVSHNIMSLFSESKSNPNDYLVMQKNVAEMEGDSIRIPVKTEGLKSLFSEFMDDVKAYLKKKTGVKQVFIDAECDAQNNCFLIVTSVGKTWQRYYLDELILDPDFEGKLNSILQK